MKKKIITLVGVALIVSSLSITSFAAMNDGSTRITRIEQLQQRQQEILNKKLEVNQKREIFATKLDEFKEFKAALFAKKDQMLVNRTENLSLREDNNKLRLEIQNAIKAIKDSTAVLPEQTLSSLKTYSEQIKVISADIKQTQGQINDLLKSNKDAIKSKDYIQMNSTFDSIYEIQKFRNDQLSEINSILKQMAELF